MKRIPADHPDTPSRLLRVLREGGVAVVPTDTLYGLSAPMSSRQAYHRIASIKHAGAERRFVYLASDVKMVERYIAGWGCASRTAFEKIWPAPLSAVFHSGGECPAWVGKTIAFRVPSHAALRRAVESLGEPILTTSVNRAGEPPLDDVGAIESRFAPVVDLIVDEGALSGGAPSTIVDFTGEEPVVLRAGAYAWDGVGNPSKRWFL